MGAVIPDTNELVKVNALIVFDCYIREYHFNFSGIYSTHKTTLQHENEQWDIPNNPSPIHTLPVPDIQRNKYLMYLSLQNS